ncbi:hypothetical protein ACFQ0O_26180 [Saccharopolyspora spinosporotrichia]|uniref:Uncharacterized protein n=1 Tax=Saccharopolyspora erythraea TaxID=1836 RepID=A0ABN1CTJ8_SACER|nr:hypothetical protein [Saccharopolyspora erythraea]QRK88137.1 hypothetical protein JQX30_25980 [Saccharopolyspora erythraea]
MYLREDLIRDAANGWIGKLFAPDNVDKAVRGLPASKKTPKSAPTWEKAQQRLTDAESLPRQRSPRRSTKHKPNALVARL